MTVDAIAVVPEDSRYGNLPRFRDEQSGCTFFVTTPFAHPDLWGRYLCGALEVYRHFDVEPALEFDDIRDGRSTSLFFLGVDPSGNTVAGVRMQGSYADVDQVRGVADWAGHPGAAALRDMVAERIPEGVVEAKGAWVARDSPYRSALGDTISRTVLHALRTLGARWGFATVATFTVDRHRSAGAAVAEHIPPAPYPDERYVTVPLWWDALTFAATAEKKQYARIRAEQVELGLIDPVTSETEDRPGHGG